MTRNRILALVSILCLSFLVTIPVMAGKEYHAESFNVGVDIQKDASLVVTETIKFRFDGGPFTYVFRDVSRNETDDVEIMRASMDGVVFPAGAGAGQVEIQTGDPIKVTWHFAPTSDSAHEFVLRYRVLGAIRTGAADALIWRAIPESHDYTIDQASIAVTYPLDKHPLRAPSLDRTFTSTALDSGSRLTTGKLDTDESVILTIQFGPGSLAGRPPAWQILQQQKDHQIELALPYGLGAAGLTLLLGAVWVIRKGRSFRRDASQTIPGTQSYASPPAASPPALAARLNGNATGFLGTLFDLARRGVLQIEEGPRKWGSRSFGVTRQPGSESFQPHEQVFLEAVFHKAKAGRVNLTAIASLAYNTKFTQALDQELDALGWRDTGRSARRSRFIVLSSIVLGVGALFLLGGLLLGGFSLPGNPPAVSIAAGLIGIGVGAWFIGLSGLMVTAFISPLSEEGLRQAVAWKSFSNYLRNVTRGREIVPSPDVFERYLPYAAAFGMATEWTKYFQKMSDMSVPGWFKGLQSSVEDGSFAAILAAVSAADSSDAAAGGGGAAGASGGGASGAG